MAGKFRRYLASVDDYNDDDSFDATAMEEAVLVFVLLSALMTVTIVFGLLKDFGLRRASKYTKPIYHALFSEMTILGFISLIAFVSTLGTVLEGWSLDLFGTGEKLYISDTLDLVQGYVMWFMVMTMIHALALVYIKQASETTLAEYNDICMDSTKYSKIIHSIDNLPTGTFYSRCADYLCNPIAAWNKYSNAKEVEDICIFFSLRREHIDRRAGIKPFLPEVREKRLPNDFDFAMYLSISMSNMLASIVTFTPFSWVCLWFFLILIFALLMACNGFYVVVAAVLLLVDVIDLILLYCLLSHIENVISLLINPAHFKNKLLKSKTMWHGVNGAQGATDSDDSPKKFGHQGDTEESKIPGDKRQVRFMDSQQRSTDEFDRTVDEAESEMDVLFPPKYDPNHTSMIYRMRHDPSSLPGFTQLDEVEQSGLSRFFLGKQVLNRHEMLLLADKLGPTLYIFLFRLHILIINVNLPIALGLLAPYMFSTYGVAAGVIYLLLQAIPPLVLFSWMYTSIANGLAMIIYSGQLRDTLIQNESLRILKMNKVFRLMMTLTKFDTADKKINLGFGDRVYDLSDPSIQAEIMEIDRIFDTYCKALPDNQDDEINRSQLKGLLDAYGISLTDESLAELFVILDSDESGTISRDELREWLMSRQKDDGSDLVNIGKRIFNMIDTDGSGDVTLVEFRNKLLEFNEPPYNANFTDSEILSLLRDFDEDGDGSISLEEFLNFIEEGIDYKALM